MNPPLTKKAANLLTKWLCWPFHMPGLLKADGHAAGALHRCGGWGAVQDGKHCKPAVRVYGAELPSCLQCAWSRAWLLENDCLSKFPEIWIQLNAGSKYFMHITSRNYLWWREQQQYHSLQCLKWQSLNLMFYKWFSVLTVWWSGLSCYFLEENEQEEELYLENCN